MLIENANDLVVAHPKSRSMRFGKFDGNDVRWTLLSVSLLIITSSLTSGIVNRLAVVALVLVWWATMQVPESTDDRIYQTPIVAFQNWWIRKVRKGVLWERGNKSRLKKLRRYTLIPVEVHAFGETGLLHNRRKKTDSLVITGTGSPLVAMTLAGQYHGHEDIAGIIRRAASVEHTPVGVSFCVRARPDDPWVFWDTVAEYGEPEVVLPAGRLKESEDYLTDYDRRMLFLETIQNSLPEISDQANSIEMAIVITIRRSEPLGKALRKGTITSAEANRQPIMRIRNIALAQLGRHGVSDVQALDAAGMERFLRMAWDVVGLEKYFARTHERAALGESATSDQWYPAKRVRVGRNYVEIDGTYSTALKMTSYRSSPLPHEPRVFYASHARWFSHCVLGETVNGNWEYRFLNLSSGFLKDIVDIIGIQYSGPKVERRERELTDRLRDIDRSTYTEAYNILATVSAGSLEELEEEVQKEIDRLTGEGMAPIRVAGESKQLPWFLSAVFCVDLT